MIRALFGKLFFERTTRRTRSALALGCPRATAKDCPHVGAGRLMSRWVSPCPRLPPARKPGHRRSSCQAVLKVRSGPRECDGSHPSSRLPATPTGRNPVRSCGRRLLPPGMLGARAAGRRLRACLEPLQGCAARSSLRRDQSGETGTTWSEGSNGRAMELEEPDGGTFARHGDRSRSYTA